MLEVLSQGAAGPERPIRNRAGRQEWINTNADYLISEIESRYEPYHDGWWITADNNGTLLERVQEVLDEYNADHGTKHTAEMFMTSVRS